MVQPGTSQIHAVSTHPMHMASPMVVSIRIIVLTTETVTTSVNDCKAVFTLRTSTTSYDIGRLDDRTMSSDVVRSVNCEHRLKFKCCFV